MKRNKNRGRKADLHRAVAASGPRSLQRVDHPPQPVLEDIRNIAQSVAVWQQIPAASAVAVVVQPRAEDEVGGDAEEDTILLAIASPLGKDKKEGTHMMINHVKNPQ